MRESLFQPQKLIDPGRINQKVQGLLRAHQAALHNEGEAIRACRLPCLYSAMMPFYVWEGTTQPTVPAAGSLPAPTMVKQAWFI